MTRKQTKGRMSTTSSATTKHFCSRSADRASAVLLAAILQCPTFLFSCQSCQDEPVSPALRTQIYIQSAEKTTSEGLDLFFFQDDSLGLLDSYQRLEGGIPDRIYGVSGNGDKILAAFSGYATDRYAWSDVVSFAGLRERRFRLSDEDPERPFLCGSAHLSAGASRSAVLTLRPRLCAIRIRSLSCDFSGMPYEGLTLDSLTLFLTHVCDECLPLATGEAGAVSWINAGAVDRKAVAALAHPEMVLQETGLSVGATRLPLGNTLYSYPNPALEDSFGRPRTRLVLQGNIGTVTCWYPIPLSGLGEERMICLDITLTRMGSPDPDILTESGTVILETETVPWSDTEPSTVHF